ncbi:MAG TPA: HD domain-containing protein [Gemmatimonadales bacterium]|nr:HD domain-containing protein [Gemmatimonadales bacterium]
MAHIERVVGLAAQWADRMRVSDAERRRWLRAAWLHDALRDASPGVLQRWAPDVSGPDELRHGPASAARAAAEGETDRGVLDAVRFHSVGYAGWDMVGRVLYCADYLEPGRIFRREERAVLAQRLPDDPAAVLRSVASERLRHLVDSAWPIPPTTVHFWNSVVESSGSR